MTKKPKNVETPPSAWPLRIANSGVQVELNRDGSVTGNIEALLDTLSGNTVGDAALAAMCAWLVKRVEDLERRINAQDVLDLDADIVYDDIAADVDEWAHK